MPEVRRNSRSKTAKEEPPTKKVKESPSEIEEGDSIPDITLKNEHDEEVSLKDVASDNHLVVIFAYPRASTPGCTRQACGFRDNYDEFTKHGAVVFGLLSDTPKSQTTFITKQKLPYSLLSDPNKELIGALGAKKSPSGIKRSHFVFVDGVLKVKKLGVSPEASFNGALDSVKEYGGEAKDEDDEGAEDDEEDGAANGAANGDRKAKPTNLKDDPIDIPEETVGDDGEFVPGDDEDIIEKEEDQDEDVKEELDDGLDDDVGGEPEVDDDDDEDPDVKE